MERLLFGRDGEVAVRLSGGVEEFVAIDFGSDSDVAVVIRFHSHDLAMTADIHIAGLGHLFGEGNDKFNRTANVEFCFGEEIEAAIADVARLGPQFWSALFARKHPEGQGHSEAPCFAAFCSVAHESSLGDCVNLKNANIPYHQTAIRKTSIFV